LLHSCSGWLAAGAAWDVFYLGFYELCVETAVELPCGVEGLGYTAAPLSLPFNLDNLRESPVQSIGMTGSPGWGISGGYTLDVTGSPVNHGVCNVQV